MYVHQSYLPGRPEQFRAPIKFFFVPQARAAWLKICTIYRNGWLNCRVNWAWSERVRSYSRQMVIQPRKAKTYITYSIPGSPSGRPGPCSDNPLYLPLSSAPSLFVGLDHCFLSKRPFLWFYNSRGLRNPLLTGFPQSLHPKVRNVSYNQPLPFLSTLILYHILHSPYNSMHNRTVDRARCGKQQWADLAKVSMTKMAF